MIANIYIDSFNLYFGCLKGTPYRWLDVAKLCNILLPHDEINRIRYFTALVETRNGNPSQQQRQLNYLRALQTIPNLSIHYGHFLTTNVSMRLAHPEPDGPRDAVVVRPEEKGSDVNLACYMLLDAFDDDCELAVVISNDSDLAFPVQVLRERFGKVVGVLNPQRNTSHKLRTTASFYRPIRRGPLSASQFAGRLRDAVGEFTKPPAW